MFTLSQRDNMILKRELAMKEVIKNQYLRKKYQLKMKNDLHEMGNRR